MTWVSSAYLDDAIGSDQVTALGLTTGTTRLAQYEIAARATVLSALQYAGYPAVGETLDTSSAAAAVTSAFLQKMCAAIMLRDAYSLIPGITLTAEAQAAISQGLTMLDAVYDKKLPVPGMAPVAIDGYGGVKFNVDISTPALAPTTPIFRRLRGSSF